MIMIKNVVIAASKSIDAAAIFQQRSCNFLKQCVVSKHQLVKCLDLHNADMEMIFTVTVCHHCEVRGLWILQFFYIFSEDNALVLGFHRRQLQVESCKCTLVN